MELEGISISPPNNLTITGMDGYETYKINDYTLGVRPKWIKCSDQLPENDDVVIVFNHKDGVHAGYFDKEEVQGYIEDDGTFFKTNSGWEVYYEWAPYMAPTHWMPLPKPPQGSER